MGQYPERIRSSLKQPQLYYVKRAGKALQGQPPTYEMGTGGGPATPTGRVMVRFADQASLERRRADIEKAGYRVEQVLAYAPQAAWISAASGDAAGSSE